MAPRIARVVFVLLTLSALILGGCASEQRATASFRIPAAEYPLYFEAARDVLRENHFSLERVDARAGLLTTAPIASAGWATPWIDHASTFSQSTNDLIQRNRRVATIHFSPVTDATNRANPLDPVSNDLRRFEGTIEVNVSVIIEQVYRPGRRLSPTSIRLATFTDDPRQGDIGPEQLVTRVVANDADLASRIADQLAQGGDISE